MSAKQSRPKLLINLGDVDPEKHGGFFVFERRSRDGGGHFVVWLQEPDDDQLAFARRDWADKRSAKFNWPERDHPSLRWTIRTADVPAQCSIDWDLSDGDTPFEYIARHHIRGIGDLDRNLSDVASACGQPLLRYVMDLCSANPIDRARVLRDFAGTYSDVVFDDEEQLTRQELWQRFGGILRKGGTLDKLKNARFAPPRKRSVRCSQCRKPTDKATAHRHQKKWVGECCWDERLRATE